MNYYEILGVRKTASQGEIKKAYKNLVKKYHPDIYKGDKTFAEKKTSQINIAYDVLSNPQSRQSYDDETFRQTTYTYTPPKYKKSYEEYKEQYNYRSNSNYRNDGSEHDYYSYVNYGGPRSNFYSQTSSYSNQFTDKIINYFDTLNNTQKKKLIILGLILLLFFILTSLLQLITILDLYNTPKTPNSSTTHYEETITPSNSNTTQTIPETESIPFSEPILTEEEWQKEYEFYCKTHPDYVGTYEEFKKETIDDYKYVQNFLKEVQLKNNNKNITE